MSSGMFCMLETKDEEKEEGEVSTELEEEEEEEEVQFDSKSSEVPLSASKPSLPPIPNLSSNCCDIPVVFGDNDNTRVGVGSVSKVILSAVSPWLASLIQGTGTD